jgi:hypothetical protein
MKERYSKIEIKEMIRRRIRNTIKPKDKATVGEKGEVEGGNAERQRKL